MKCTKCNNEILEGSKFCNHCGAKQEFINGIKCTCGYINPLDAIFCTECGTRIENRIYISSDNENEFEAIGSFSEGLAWIKKGGKYGFVNDKYEIVTEIIFEQVENFKSGLAKVCLNGMYVVINKRGDVKFYLWQK